LHELKNEEPLKSLKNREKETKKGDVIKEDLKETWIY